MKIFEPRLLKFGSFSSVEQLKERIVALIAYFNRILTKSFKCTYTRHPLQA